MYSFGERHQRHSAYVTVHGASSSLDATSDKTTASPPMMIAIAKQT